MDPYHSWFNALNIQFNPLLLILVILFLMLSAFFSSTEMAFSAVGKVRLKTLVNKDVRGSKKALWIAQHFDKTLTTLLVGNNLANIALTTVSVLMFRGIFDNLVQNPDTVVSVINTIVVTVIVLIFGEIIPKSIAKSSPEKFALKVSGVLYFLIFAMGPLTYVFRMLNKRVMRNRSFSRKQTVTESELETIIDTMEREGSIDEEEADMLQKVLDLDEITVEEIMTPRVDMVALDLDEDVQSIVDAFMKNKFSRIPVYQDNYDNVIGVLYERDFYAHLIRKQHPDIRKLLRKPIFIPSSTRVDTLIELLQTENSHLALVIDEYGGVDGLVTMEDALEELVGEIYDEHDEVVETITKKSDNQYLINADYDLEDLFDDLDLGNPPICDATSVGGWLFEKFQDIPEVGQTVTFTQTIHQVYNDLSEVISEEIETLTFEISKVSQRRIQQVLLTVDISKEIQDNEEPSVK